MDKIDYEYYNGEILRLISTYLNFGERSITEKEIKSLTSCGIDKEHAFRRLLIAYLDIRDPVLSDEYLKKMPKLLCADEFKNDPYFKEISFASASFGKWKIGRGTYAPYELFVYDDFVYDGEKVIPSLGFFDEEFSFPAVYENGRLWMSVTPNEINTMKEPIANAKGNVLTFGLGLGYYAYMCSRKDTVKTVTVVERDGEIIRLFEKHILPKFAAKDKIKIVRADAYEYLDTLDDGKYDTAFVDIYHDAGDGVEVYEKFKNKKFEKDAVRLLDRKNDKVLFISGISVKVNICSPIDK